MTNEQEKPDLIKLLYYDAYWRDQYQSEKPSLVDSRLYPPYWKRLFGYYDPNSGLGNLQPISGPPFPPLPPPGQPPPPVPPLPPPPGEPGLPAYNPPWDHIPDGEDDQILIMPPVVTPQVYAWYFNVVEKFARFSSALAGIDDYTIDYDAGTYTAASDQDPAIYAFDVYSDGSIVLLARQSATLIAFKFDSSGDLVWDTQLTDNADTFSYRVCVAPNGGCIVDYYDNNVSERVLARLNSSGAVTDSIAPDTNAIFAGGIATDNDGNVYWATDGNGVDKVYKFSPDLGTEMWNVDIVTAFRVAYDKSTNKLWVMAQLDETPFDPNIAQILQLDPSDGSEILRFIATATNDLGTANLAAGFGYVYIGWHDSESYITRITDAGIELNTATGDAQDVAVRQS